jgi:hypothetical protein
MSLHGLPSSLTAIGGSAFADCTGITSLHGLPSSLTTIKRFAFAGCSGITSLDGLPSSLTVIGETAFSGCTAITSIGSGFDVDCDIHPNTFNHCPQLQAAAAETRHSDVGTWGKAVWQYIRLRLAVIQSVHTAYRVIDAHGDATAAPLHSLLRLLASVPNSGDNRSPFKASQVLRRIVDYVGKGFAILGNESSVERLNRSIAELRQTFAAQQETNATQQETISTLQEANSTLQETISSQQETIASLRLASAPPGTLSKRQKKS